MTAPEDGPGGLNHNHRWNGGFSINAKTAAMPRVILDPQDGIDGLFDTADHNDKREDRTAQIGETVYPNYPRGKTVLYKGELEAANEAGLNRLRQQMRAAFAAGMSTPRLIDIIPDAAYGSDVWSYFARVLPGGLSIPEKVYRSRFHPHGAFARTFQLSLRMLDSRFLLTSGYQSFAGNTAGVYHAVPNYDAPADPKFTVTVPSGLPDVTLRSNTVSAPSGLARLRFLAVPAGSLVVDFTQGSRFATIAGNDAIPYLDTAYSNWWDEFIDGLAPGSNSVTAEGAGLWKVEYFPRCW
jgi:hypothetical protein